MSKDKKTLVGLAQLDDAGLSAKLAELRRSAYDLRVHQAVGQLEKPSRIVEVRKSIARVKTIARQRALGKVTVSATMPEAKAATKAAKAPAKAKAAPRRKAKAS